MRKNIRMILCLLLCLAMLPVMPVRADAEEYEVIDRSELDRLAEDFISSRELQDKHISIGLCYTATGEYWYYNGDEWFYPASMYKVPLMMLLSEEVAAGELSLDSDFFGKSVRDVQELILTYSNNDWAHRARTYLGGDQQWRSDAKQYASLADSEYDPDYMDYCYFSNRYITEVMHTLFSEPERFPNVTECLLQAEPEGYFRLELEGQYDIAQKYGSYTDAMAQQFHSNTGIIYTENPIIVTVMTVNVSGYEKVISDAAVMLLNYCLGKDAELIELEARQQELEQQALAEEKAAEEARQQEMAKQQQELKEQLEAQEAQAKEEAENKYKSPATIIVIAAAVISAAFGAMAAARGKKKRRADQRRAPQRRNYTPRH